MPRRFRDEGEVQVARAVRQRREHEQAVAEEPGGASYFSAAIHEKFPEHDSDMRVSARKRRDAVQLRNVVADKDVQEAVTIQDTLGKRQPGDVYQGDVNIRTLRTLLSIIDGRGFERSPHQMRFHSAFERATARVTYRADWETQRPAIMKKHEWKSCPGEVMISTPRRFGKTFCDQPPRFEPARLPALACASRLKHGDLCRSDCNFCGMHGAELSPGDCDFQAIGDPVF